MQEEGPKKTNLDSVVSSFNRDEREHEVREKAEQLGMPYFDVRGIEISPDVLSLVGKAEAQKGIIPISQKGKELTLGAANPKSPEAQKTFKYLAKHFKATLALISWDSVKDILPRFEGLNKQILDRPSDYEIQALETPLTFKELETQINNAPLQDILKFVVTMAVQSGASDIHLEPQKEGARVRFRIDGVLHIVGNLVPDRFKYILSQIELASGMKLNVDEAQEGRLEVKMKDKNLGIRVETMPTLYGDDISLRLFNTETTMLKLTDLGFYDYSRKVLDEALTRPQGMILLVGPTGAGKTSTIYAILNELNTTEVKVITLEDPIEYALPGATQSQIREDESFFERLKAVLREDPDIVMVGEIRDPETADTALQAALTGHVMISTFHANNAATALARLRELSKERALMAPAINLIIAQRLVRKLCTTCRKPYAPNEQELVFAKKVFEEIPAEVIGDRKLRFYISDGCEACNGIGYLGRTGIFELLTMTKEIQKIISKSDLMVTEIQDLAKQGGMVTMEQDGLLKALDGVTSISEVMKKIKE